MIGQEKQKAKVQMKRVQAILAHPVFRESLKANDYEERERIYCRHDMTHFLDVARIAYILSLENGLSVEKEMIYAAALLHDIGRWQQYRYGTAHEKASEEIGRRILQETGFSAEEQEVILQAIAEHRNIVTEHLTAGTDVSAGALLAEVIYAADKLSRSCYACEANNTCNWNEEKKNMQIIL